MGRIFRRRSVTVASSDRDASAEPAAEGRSADGIGAGRPAAAPSKTRTPTGAEHARPPGTEEDGFWQVPDRFNFARDVVEALAALEPQRPALTFVDSYGVVDRRTFAQVATQGSRWAGLLRSYGLVPGDRVLVVVGKRPEWPAIVLGALKAGLVTVPCSTMLQADELAFRGEHSDARLVVADREGAAVLARVDVPVEVVLVDEVADELRRLSTTQPTHDTMSDDIAFILYTSGMTKDPKGAVHTHASTWANRLQAEHWLDARPGDLVWCTSGTGSPKSIWNVLLGPWSCGAETVIHEGGFDAEQRFDLLQWLGVTVLCQTPIEYRVMARLPSLGRMDLSRVRHAASTGESLDPEVIGAFRDTFELTVHDGYGQTEAPLLVANAPGTPVKPGSMGLPTPGHDVAVIDAEGNEQPVGVEGDIALRGKPPSLFLGYWDAPDETSAAFRGEWYVTGDRAIRDDEGYLWFRGQAHDAMLSSSHRIGPVEVESALLEHPAVAESAVVGKPDAGTSELLEAFVVLRTGVEPSDELILDLHDRMKAMTAPYRVPREIEFVSELPRTATGELRVAESPAAQQAEGAAAAAERRRDTENRRREASKAEGEQATEEARPNVEAPIALETHQAEPAKRVTRDSPAKKSRPEKDEASTKPGKKPQVAEETAAAEKSRRPEAEAGNPSRGKRTKQAAEANGSGEDARSADRPAE
jgi:acyl-coenzyme A synthetase/AMP-(fatty) acid ligase